VADWTYTPAYVYEIERLDGEVLVTTFPDGRENRRQKSAHQKRRFRERHLVDSVTLAAMVAFYLLKLLYGTFTKKTYDPNEAPNTETTVRFERRPVARQVALDSWEVDFVFLEVLA
jgi:hypothetical protein